MSEIIIEEYKNVKGIYKFTNKINGKVYVGQSINLYKRYKHHLSSVNCISFYIQNAFKKHGIENFKFEIIEIITDINILDERETYWINYYDACNRLKGYNLKPDAKTMKGFKFSQESKNKMSESRKEFYKKNPEARLKNLENVKNCHTKESKRKAKKALIEYFRTHKGNTSGKILSEEHKNKISNSLNGRKMSSNSIKKGVETRIKNGTYKKLSRIISKIDPNSGEILETYSTLTVASKISSIPRSTLHLSLNNKTNKNGEKYLAGGFDWEYSS